MITANKSHSKDRLSETETRLIEDNLRLAAAQAHSFKNSGYDIQDLISIGYIGLVKAAKSFKPELGFQFSTLATICIRHEISRELKKSRLTKKPEELTIDIEGVEDGHFWDLVPENLDDKEKTILKMRLIDNLTFREIGDKVGCTKAWASKKYQNIIEKIKAANEKT